MSERDFQELMQRIKARREELGLSYQDLANLTGMSKSTLQRYETGDIKNFPVGKLPDLARALQTTEYELTGWDYPKSVQTAASASMGAHDLFSSRLREAMVVRGLKQVDLCEKTGIPKSALSQYLGGHFEPKQDRLWKLAAALSVSEAWLLGYDVPMEPQAPTSAEPDPLAGALFAAYGEVKEEFDEDDIADIQAFMRMVAERKRKRAEKAQGGTEE